VRDERLPFGLDEAGHLRRAIGESVRAIRRGESMADGRLETLGFLARDGAQSIASLARLRRVRHQTMSTVVADLERQGLVGRTPDPDDARGVLVTITPAGDAVVQESRTSRARRMLAAADAALDEDERATLVRAAAVLDKLAAALRASEPD